MGQSTAIVALSILVIGVTAVVAAPTPSLNEDCERADQFHLTRIGVAHLLNVTVGDIGRLFKDHLFGY